MAVEIRNSDLCDDVAMSDSETLGGKALGRAVAETARLRQMSYVKLSERTKELGAPIHRVALSKIERGERDVTVKELVALGAALEMPPLQLVFPNVLDDVEVLPGVKVTGLEALGWFTGLGDATPGVEQSAVADLFDSDQGIRLAIKLVQIEQALKVQRHNLIQAELSPDLLGMSEQMKNLQRHRADGARHEIEMLEGERTRLVHLYTRAIEVGDE